MLVNHISDKQFMSKIHVYIFYILTYIYTSIYLYIFLIIYIFKIYDLYTYLFVDCISIKITSK